MKARVKYSRSSRTTPKPLTSKAHSRAIHHGRPETHAQIRKREAHHRTTGCTSQKEHRQKRRAKQQEKEERAKHLPNTRSVCKPTNTSKIQNTNPQPRVLAPKSQAPCSSPTTPPSNPPTASSWTPTSSPTQSTTNSPSCQR